MNDDLNLNNFTVVLRDTGNTSCAMPQVREALEKQWSRGSMVFYCPGFLLPDCLWEDPNALKLAIDGVRGYSHKDSETPLSDLSGSSIE